MIGRIAEHIDKESFVSNLSQRIPDYGQLFFDLFVSDSCNLHCEHCYFLDYKPQGKSLPLRKWYEILEESVDVGIRHFHFSGKEPFCEPNIPLLLNRLNQLSNDFPLKYGLITNGTMLTGRHLQELLDSNISYIEFSLEGDIKYNLKVRGINSFEYVYSLIRDIPVKTKLNITSTFFGDNLHELENMINVFVKIGVTKFNIAPYLKYENNVLLPVKELGFNRMVELVNHFRQYLETVDAESIDIRICISRRQAVDMFMLENSLSNDIDQYAYDQKRMIFKIGENVLEVNYPLLYIPYLTQIVITNDGVVIPCADDIHYKNLHEISLGRIEDGDVKSVLIKREEFILNYINQKIQ